VNPTPPPNQLNINQILPADALNWKGELKTESPQEQASRLKIAEGDAAAKRTNALILLILGVFVTISILMIATYIIAFSGASTSEELKKSAWTGIIGLGTGIFGFALGKAQKD